MFRRRYACVRQADRTDCGPAALATVALHFGMRLSRERMRDLAGTDRAGTNLLGVLRAAERLGMQCRAVKGDWDGLPTVALPAIAHVKTDEGLGHFIVLHRLEKDGVIVADPARGVERLTRAAFTARWSGYLLLLAPGTRFTVDRTRPFSPTRRFFELLFAYRSAVLEGFACAVLMTVLGISTSYFIQHLVDSVLARGEGGFLDALGIGMALIIVFRTLFGALRQYLMAYIARQTGIRLIADYSRHILHLPMRFFEMRQVGDILARVNDAAKVREVIGGVTLTVLVDGTMVLITLFVLWMYDGALALVASAFVPVMIASVLAHHPFARRRAVDAMEGSGRLSGHLVEDISGVETIKALGVERARAEEGEDHVVRVMQSAFSLQKLGVSSTSAATLAMGMAGIVILWYGGHRVMSGAVSIGQLMFFHSLLAYMLQPLERLASVNLQVQDALVAVDRLFQIMDLDAEQAPASQKSELPGIRRAIELRGVGFEYGTRGKVVQGIDLEIPAGAKVALLGESGSGKTTLLKLLMRFYDPTEGQVLIDGVDLRDIDIPSLRSRIGLVPQEPYIFTGSIRDNIAMARPDATMHELVEAVRAAGLEETIARMPERFDTVIGERGANLSGGQRQRLAIARALLKQPDLLIFDEATSHLDTATERAIQETLKVALAGKTVVLVAHRLSTVRDADLIYVLEKGRIVERGSHAQLLAQGGAYAALWRAQSLDGEPAEPADVRARPKLLAGVAHAE